jgi:hypothetical protein
VVAAVPIAKSVSTDLVPPPPPPHSRDMAAVESAPAQRLWVHLDMKGSSVSAACATDLLPYMVEWGATGLLLEWEDAFPWHGPLQVRNGRAHHRAAAATPLLPLPYTPRCWPIRAAGGAERRRCDFCVLPRGRAWR